MKNNKLLLMLVTAASIGLFSAASMAKQIALFEQPDSKSKVIGTVDLASGIIPIFTPKDSKWVKIADPRNGNVGWVKSTELSPDGSSSFTFSTRYITDDNKSGTYQVMQFGNTNQKVSKEQLMQIERLQEQQQAIRQSVNQSIENMVDGMNKLYKQYQDTMKNANVPVVMPILLIPENSTNPSKEKKTSKPKNQ